MSLFFGIVTAAYVLMILYFLFGMGKNKKPKEVHLPPKISFSIIVPFRNEEKNLPALFNSLKAIDYPQELMEIIMVDDASEDTSAEICHQFKASFSELAIRTIPSERKTGSPKKDAVTTGVAAAEKNFILSTDADCTFPKNWLRALSSFIESNDCDLVSGPVMVEGNKKSNLTAFQQLDFLSLQGITLGAFGMGKPFLCNGANLCYKRKVFLAVEGFEGNENIASGDDVFLLEKLHHEGYKLGYLEDATAIVRTTPQLTLKNLYSQRLRWAAKTSATRSLLPKIVGILVFLMNLLLVTVFFLYLTGTFSPTIFLYCFLFKFNADFLILYRTASFFDKERLMRNYLWASILYPFFCTSVVIGSFFFSFHWKDRKYNK